MTRDDAYVLPRTPLEYRFWNRVEKTDSCWLWTGRLNEDGYSNWIIYNGRRYRSHQLSYFLAKGSLPADGLVLDHLCRVRHCVNPHHLEAVTSEENLRRGVEARRLLPCRRGHALDARKGTSRGHVICGECQKESDRRRDERDREKRRAAARERYANNKKASV